jgi:hypothetical protein
MVDEAPGMQPIGEIRERTIDRLSDHFANDRLDVEEFERRVDLAHRAGNVSDLEALLGDLPGDPKVALVPVAPAPLATRPAPAALAPSQVRQSSTVVAVMSGSRRTGAWAAPRHLRSFAMMGGIQLDFRDAILPPEGLDLTVVSVMGGVDIVVPPELPVVADGLAIMGGFDHVHRAPATPDAGRPVLRVRGFVLMGGVSISMRLRGESERDARRRQRHERRQARREGRHRPAE